MEVTLVAEGGVLKKTRVFFLAHLTRIFIRVLFQAFRADESLRSFWSEWKFRFELVFYRSWEYGHIASNSVEIPQHTFFKHALKRCQLSTETFA